VKATELLTTRRATRPPTAQGCDTTNPDALIPVIWWCSSVCSKAARKNITDPDRGEIYDKPMHEWLIEHAGGNTKWSDTIRRSQILVVPVAGTALLKTNKAIRLKYLKVLSEVNHVDIKFQQFSKQFQADK